MKNEIRYGHHVASGIVIHISQAKRGLRCGCNCKDCGSELEAIKGGLRTHYFRHSNGKNCSGESAIHFFCKQVIATASSINLPTGRINYENVRIEESLDNKRPDITVTVDEEDLHIEIRVTNAVKEDKRQFYCKGSHKCIEIDLSDRTLWLLPPEELKQLILEETWNKQIINWNENNKTEVNIHPNGYSFADRFLGVLLYVGIFLFAFKLIFPGKRH